MMYLRELSEAEYDLMFIWRNHPAIRQFSRDIESIDLLTHMAWIKSVKANPKVKIFTINTDLDRLGVGGFDIDGKGAILSFYMNPDMIGHHYGRGALATLLAYGFNNLEFETIIAECHASNDAFTKLYEGSGFKAMPRDEGMFITYTIDRPTWNTSLFPF